MYFGSTVGTYNQQLAKLYIFVAKHNQIEYGVPSTTSSS